MHTYEGDLHPETKISKVKPVKSIENKHQRLFALDDDTRPDISQKELTFHDLGTSDSRQVSSSHHSRRLSSVGAFAVQCASCFKWRLVPTKQKYEEIRETILEDHFVCEKAQEWHPDVSCSDPADISQDGKRLWAIDKPNIPRPPPGWERILKIRGEGSAHFADVYYTAPSGKRLRSTVEVEKYLLEHGEFVDQGVKMSQFSFQKPRPLQENYVRRRQGRSSNARQSLAGVGSSVPVESDGKLSCLVRCHHFLINPISWLRPDASTTLQLGRP